MILKQEARKIIFEKRKGEGREFFNTLNKEFDNHFLLLDYFKNLKNKKIAGYCAFGNECNIFNILKYLSLDNQILLPVVIEKNKKMIFREWDCNFDSLKRNKIFTKSIILEPDDSSREFQPDIVFMPAVAVDSYGSRVGYGGGYYDRTLANINVIKIATVFDFQVFTDNIETNEYDVAVDWILTEKNFINATKISNK